jgi:hypothetical protein
VDHGQPTVDVLEGVGRALGQGIAAHLSPPGSSALVDHRGRHGAMGVGTQPAAPFEPRPRDVQLDQRVLGRVLRALPVTAHEVRRAPELAGVPVHELHELGVVDVPHARPPSSPLQRNHPCPRLPAHLPSAFTTSTLTWQWRHPIRHRPGLCVVRNCRVGVDSCDVIAR